MTDLPISALIAIAVVLVGVVVGIAVFIIIRSKKG